MYVNMFKYKRILKLNLKHCRRDKNRLGSLSLPSYNEISSCNIIIEKIAPNYVVTKD